LEVTPPAFPPGARRKAANDASAFGSDFQTMRRAVHRVKGALKLACGLGRPPEPLELGWHQERTVAPRQSNQAARDVTQLSRANFFRNC
jgi:hypothetical protein